VFRARVARQPRNEQAFSAAGALAISLDGLGSDVRCGIERARERRRWKPGWIWRATGPRPTFHDALRMMADLFMFAPLDNSVPAADGQ